MKIRKQKLEIKQLTANDAKPVLAVVLKCSHFWKMVAKNYYKCSWCDKRHYC
jgi:hypothetical protein